MLKSKALVILSIIAIVPVTAVIAGAAYGSAVTHYPPPPTPTPTPTPIPTPTPLPTPTPTPTPMPTPLPPLHVPR
jgi:hypothetical protein